MHFNDHLASACADLTQRTIRTFLKARTSYDVLPISYRLIVLDTALLVKKSLNILNQNGMRFRHVVIETELTAFDRHCISTSLGLQDIYLCWPVDHFRLHQRDPVLLAEPGRTCTSRPIPLEQPARYACYPFHYIPMLTTNRNRTITRCQAYRNYIHTSQPSSVRSMSPNA